MPCKHNKSIRCLSQVCLSSSPPGRAGPWPPCSAQSPGPRRGWGGRCRCSAASWRRRSPTPCPPRRRRPERSPRPPSEAPGRNRTSETSLRRPTPKPCHHGLLSQNGALSLSGQKCVKGLEKRGRLRGFGLFSTEVGNPTSLHTEVGWGRCGPGAGLVRAWQSWVGHRIAASILRGMPQSCAGNRIASAIPSHTQDCPGALPAALAWSRSCLSLVMEPALL